MSNKQPFGLKDHLKCFGVIYFKSKKRGRNSIDCSFLCASLFDHRILFQIPSLSEQIFGLR
jgi:hypothetical protein